MVAESDVAFKTTHQFIKDPDRLMVDIDRLKPSLTLRELVAKIVSNDPYIRQTCMGQNWPSVVRLVFDLEGSVNLQVFTLLPIAGYRDRLVLDLYLTNPSDPLAQFIQTIEGKQERSATSGGVSMLAPSNSDDPVAALARRDSSTSSTKPVIEEP